MPKPIRRRLRGGLGPAGKTDGTAQEVAGRGATHVVLDRGSWSVDTCRFSPDGRHVAFECLGGVKLWDLATNRLVHFLEHQAMSDCAFSPDGQLLVTTSYRGTAAVWSVSTGELLGTKTNYYGISGCAFSPDGRGFLTVDSMNILHQWSDMGDQNFWGGIGLDENRNGYMHICTISPDGHRTVYNSWYQGMQVWDLYTRKPVLTLEGRPGEVSTCSFSPDGRLIVASGSNDHHVWVWDGATGEHLTSLTGHTEHVYDHAFAPDGRFIATASEDTTLRVWELPSGRSVIELPHAFPLCSVAFHPWAPKVACGDKKGNLHLWELCDHERGPLIVTPFRHPAGLRVRCPACWQEQGLAQDGLGRELVCATLGCQAQLRANPFALTP